MGAYQSSLSSPAAHVLIRVARLQTALTLRGWVAITMIALMLAVAVAIEVAYFFSYKLNGYNVDLLAKYGSPQFFGVSASFDHHLTRVPLAH